MEEQKLTTEELYGKSEAPASQPTKPLIYEETPIIEPVPPTPPPKVPNKSGGCLKTIGTIAMYVVLFGVGVWLSAIFSAFESTPAQPVVTSTPYPTLPPSTPTQGVLGWKTYQLAGGISYQLPDSVLAPTCDGTSCGSQGTYLAGGTRFTLASHNNAKQFSTSAVIVDSGGREFTTTQVSVLGKKAFGYEGLFSGTTTGGYGFTQMRGVMILLDDTQTLELNHFTPSGVSADFAEDDTC